MVVGGRPVARLRGGIDATIYAEINGRDLPPILTYVERAKLGAVRVPAVAQQISHRQVSSNLMRAVLVMTY